MLPAPVSYHAKREFHLRSQRRTRDILLSRARVTNLGLVLLISFAALSFLFNLGYYFSYGAGSYSLPHLHDSSPEAILSTIERSKTLSSINHLVIVPGHAIWKGTHPERGLDEDNWILEPYQRGGGRVAAFYGHIVRGYV